MSLGNNSVNEVLCRKNKGGKQLQNSLLTAKLFSVQGVLGQLLNCGKVVDELKNVVLFMEKLVYTLNGIVQACLSLADVRPYLLDQSCANGHIRHFLLHGGNSGIDATNFLHHLNWVGFWISALLSREKCALYHINPVLNDVGGVLHL